MSVGDFFFCCYDQTLSAVVIRIQKLRAAIQVMDIGRCGGGGPLPGVVNISLVFIEAPVVVACSARCPLDCHLLFSSSLLVCFIL